MCLRAEVFPFFLFEAEVGESDKEDFKDNIVVRKFGWTCENLSKFKNHLMSKQTLIISQFEKIENLI